MAAHFEQRVVRASKLNFTVLEMGEGPLVLCLHGFPDTAYSFRNQLPVLADAGYHAIAPFMRGYAPTEPAPDGRYDSAVLSEDALALIDALGYKEAIIFGHDWGAVAAYGAAAQAPDVVKKLITAAVPYGTSFFQALVTNYAQQRRSWYMFFFQTAIAEAAVGYYRATLGPALKLPAQPSAIATAMAAPIEVPTLMFHGRDDGCIGAELLVGMEALFPRGLKIEVVPRAGHFVHQEKPELVNRLMLQFLKSGI